MVVLHFPRVSRFVMIICMTFLATMIQLKHDTLLGATSDYLATSFTFVGTR